MQFMDFLKSLLGAPRSRHASTQAQPAAGPASFVERRRVARPPARTGLNVLIIDDSATIVALLGKLLRQNSYITTGAGDAESGLEIARTQAPDLIFLDIVLPGMSGFDALRQLRRDPATRGIPVIMISGNVQATEEFYVQRIGADDFMKKPFGRAEVFARIHKLMEAGRLPMDDMAPARAPVLEDTTASSVGAR